MGSKGIKRRKPRRTLPPVHLGPGDSDEPPVMWPAAGSGFEADPFSPAGTAQREWFLIRRAGQSRVGKGFVWVVLAALLVVLVAGLVSSLT